MPKGLSPARGLANILLVPPKVAGSSTGATRVIHRLCVIVPRSETPMWTTSQGS